MKSDIFVSSPGNLNMPPEFEDFLLKSLYTRNCQNLKVHQNHWGEVFDKMLISRPQLTLTKSDYLQGEAKEITF